MTGSLLPNAEQQFCDQNGRPYVGGRVYFYEPSTLRPKSTWSDVNLTILNTNPVVLDAAGRAVIFGTGYYRQILKDVTGNTIWDKITTVDNSGGRGAVTTFFSGSYTAVGGGTTLTMAEPIPDFAEDFLQFFRNGVRQMPEVDYTTDNTTTVTLTSAYVLGDLFWWVYIGPTAFSGAIPYTARTLTAAESPYTPSIIDDMLICDCTAGPIQIRLYSALSQVIEGITVIKSDATANLVTPVATGSDTLVGSAILVFQNQAVTLKSNTVSKWYAT